MIPTADRLTAGAVRGALSGAAALLRVEVRESVDSTNARLLAAGEAGEAQGAVLLAGTQTAGRGRMGRNFYSPDDTGIYMSVLLRPQTGADAMAVTAQAAVAACEAIEAATPARPAIKWVNDILIGERKVCGILAESRALTAQGGGFVVLGIGMNVYAPPEGFPAQIAGVAGCISAQRQSGLRSALAAGFLNSFMHWYADGCPQELAAAYAHRCALTGKRVRVLRACGERAALVLGTDAQCRLRVRYDNGEEEALGSGEISIRL
ncbi:MAG: biotin--[acetyl-CoA-carboxylase] ligase [Oscillospiraceae bacterium]|nr:biotin--[acetyl-CoA-carboxylase] ligase [Oscillospiraceae bacterium]